MIFNFKKLRSLFEASDGAWSTVFVLVLIIAALINISTIWQVYLEIEVWRHDSLYYLKDYSGKLQTEGRWVNYLLFDQLRRVNPYVAAILHVLALSAFLAVAAFKVCRSIPYSVMIVLVCIVSAPIYIQVLWPVTTLPAFVVLAAATIVQKHLPINLFFLVFGVLLFASMGHLYFLLPLLYIRRYTSLDVPLGARLWMLLSQLVFPWIVGYVAGYVVATAVVYAITGQLGIQLAGWRQAMPIEGIDSLLSNFSTAFGYLHQHLLQYFSMLGWISVVLILALFASSYVRRKRLFHLLIPLLVMLALYASVLPYGIHLSFRTSITLWVGLVFIFLVIPDLDKIELPLYSAVIFLVFSLFAVQTRSNLTWYRDSINIYRSEFESVMVGEPHDYKGLVFLSERQRFPAVEEHINSLLGLGPTLGIKTLATLQRWPAVAHQVGFSRLRLCTADHEDELCVSAFQLVEQSPMVSPGGLYRAAELPSGWFAVQLDNQFGMR